MSKMSSKVKCTNCLGFGHISLDCTSKPLVIQKYKDIGCRTSPAQRFSDILLCLLDSGSWKSPPSIALRVTRKPRCTGFRQKLEDKRLDMARKGINTPSTPYLR
jgi:hypothetical protein